MDTIANNPEEKLAKRPAQAAWTDQNLTNPHEVKDKRQRVQSMFAAIAPSYDLNNRLHSLWQDQRWRRNAVKLSTVKINERIVDVACGTGDLAIAFDNYLQRLCYHDYIRAPRYNAVGETGVLGIDFTLPMLPIARSKDLDRDAMYLARVERIRRRRRDPLAGDDLPLGPPRSKIRWINGDAQSMPLPDQCCDVISIAFGIRNVQDPAAALKEFHRVLKPNGRVIILEFSLPTNPILRALYNFYFRQILPRTATWISGDKTGAYKYLPQSVNTFIGRAQMMSMMRDAGFDRVEQFPMTFGVCVCYRGYKRA